jgi:hypothetical protein
MKFNQVQSKISTSFIGARSEEVEGADEEAGAERDDVDGICDNPDAEKAR